MTKIHTPKTVQELRTILDARKPYCAAIAAAVRAGDIAATETAQRIMREAFPEG